MSAHKYIDRICLAGALVSLLLSLLLMNGQALGIQAASRTMGYENRLFDASRVHSIDIVMDDWEEFIDTCENEEYSSCAVVIDGEAYRNVGLRAKGNTSLSTVSRMDSDRYSFKIEFDHYDSGKTCYGLDKLSLNNVIQDNTCMKDYLTYRLMAEFGANAPLCSFVYITVNGQDWGLYLGVEGLEDGFLQRNYGQDHGQLYKPDSTGIGGGRGNGREFDMGDFMGQNGGAGDAPAGFAPFGQSGAPADFSPPGQSGGRGFGQGAMGGGMGSSDVKLQYVDDDPDSYANIFDNAKTNAAEADQLRLIQSLKALGGGGDVSKVVDIDRVLRYFVVHNFVVNGDSYTGSMVHNYYLYEEDGRLSMLPWDYNLAFGGFQSGNASGAVNDPIDSPLSVTGNGDRPMADWIFASETYTRMYHQYFEEFLSAVDPIVIIEEAHALIAPYVERDPSKFCTTQEFEIGVETLKTFCALRAESVSGQLAGSIPSTGAGQSENRDALVDASSLTLSDMGSMNSGGGFGGRGGFDRFDGEAQPVFGAAIPSPAEGDAGEMPGRQPFGEGQRPDDGAAMPSQPGGEAGETFGRQPFGNGQRPDGVEAGNFGGFPGGQAPGDGESQTAATLVLLGVSGLVLLLGLLAAFKFRRR